MGICCGSVSPDATVYTQIDEIEKKIAQVRVSAPTASSASSGEGGQRNNDAMPQILFYGGFDQEIDGQAEKD